MQSGEYRAPDSVPGLHPGYAPMHEPPTMVFLQGEKKPRCAGAEGVLRRCAAHT